MQYSKRVRGQWKNQDVPSDQVASAMIADARNGDQLSVWCADPQAIANALKLKGIKAQVITLTTGSKAGKSFVGINSPFSSVEDDLAMLANVA